MDRPPRRLRQRDPRRRVFRHRQPVRGHAHRLAAGGARRLGRGDVVAPPPRRAARRTLAAVTPALRLGADRRDRSEEHTSELQSLMRISYAVFCLKKKKNKKTTPYT